VRRLGLGETCLSWAWKEPNHQTMMMMQEDEEEEARPGEED
jgi:hypothetical protein